MERMTAPYGLHWFRRDLRVKGNPALTKNWIANQGRVVGLFSFDQTFLDRPDFSHNRFQFFLHTLQALREDLRAQGSDLLVLNQGPQDAFPWILKKMKDRPSLVTWNRDYEPFSRTRDAAIYGFLEKEKIPTKTARDHLLIEPHELGKDDAGKEGYQVYSPFARKWRLLFETEKVQARVKEQLDAKDLKFDLNWPQVAPSLKVTDDSLESFVTSNLKKVTVEIPEAGSKVALQKLKDFVKKIDRYKEDRDFPERHGNSRLSIYLKNGSLTVPQIIAHLKLKSYGKAAVTARDVFFSELIWREFYYHVLSRHPRVENEAFLEKYKNIKWSQNRKNFEAWCEGKTGFPIVDAGMRELATTGFMHNRVRMIVASFLTKDLHINWQWGEKHFMNLLLDGDLAPNNGGWQWAASTGTDPQPYFRIFNPWNQSLKFDPEGTYIKKFIPELKHLPAEALHEPILGHKTYPAPIVEHSVQSKKAIELYKLT